MLSAPSIQTLRQRPHAALLLALLALLTACQGPLTVVVGLQPGDQTLKTTVVQEAQTKTKDTIALVDVSGLIMNAPRDGLLRRGENPVSFLQEQLNAAADDQNIRAVILRINSPGGGVTASDAMYRIVQRFKEESGKPVVALCMDVAASGGYYLACAADQIVAYPSTVTGSIGVILQTVQLEPALNRWGIQTDAIVSGPNKDAGSPLSTMTEDQRETLQSLVDDFYGDFVQVVKDARPSLASEKSEAVFDGRVFSGKQAFQLGLIDDLGDLEDAVSAALKLAGLPDANLVLLHRPLSYVATPYSPSASGAPSGITSGSAAGGTSIQQQNNLIHLALDGTAAPLGPAPGFYYLWTGR